MSTFLQEAIKLAHERTGRFWHQLSVDERLPFIREIEERLGVKPPPRTTEPPPHYLRGADGSSSGISGGTRR
jgi:hypothetical protein